MFSCFFVLLIVVSVCFFHFPVFCASDCAFRGCVCVCVFVFFLVYFCVSACMGISNCPLGVPAIATTALSGVFAWMLYAIPLFDCYST